MSIRSIAKAMNENGIAISTATVARYVEALESAKIIYSCPAFDMKSKKSIGGQIKHYLSDLSFYFALNTNNALNFGPSLENITYIYARHMDYSVSVGRYGNLECDFILRNASNEYAYVQVSYVMLGDEETEEREYRPLEKIKDNYPKYILTMDPLQQQRNGIQHYNIADFMKKGRRF